jgi:hypothetical protein
MVHTMILASHYMDINRESPQLGVDLKNEWTREVHLREVRT